GGASCPSFFAQAADGIRSFHVTGVQTCALPISTVLLYLSLAVGGASYAQMATDPGDESPTRLKVLSYNLRFGELASLEELAAFRSEERRVGKEWRPRWRARRGPGMEG